MTAVRGQEARFNLVTGVLEHVLICTANNSLGTQSMVLLKEEGLDNTTGPRDRIPSSVTSELHLPC